MAWCRQATSHYLSQCRLRSMSFAIWHHYATMNRTVKRDKSYLMSYCKLWLLMYYHRFNTGKDICTSSDDHQPNCKCLSYYWPDFSPDKHLEDAVCYRITKLMIANRFANACDVNVHVHSYFLNIFCWLYIIRSEQWNGLKYQVNHNYSTGKRTSAKNFHSDGMLCYIKWNKF